MLLHVWLSATPWPTRLFCPEYYPGKNSRVSCYFLLQAIYLTQGSNPPAFLTVGPPGKPPGHRVGILPIAAALQHASKQWGLVRVLPFASAMFEIPSSLM